MFLKIFLFILLSISCLAEQLSFPGVKFTNLLLPQLGKLAVDTDVIKKIYKEDKNTALCKLVKSFYNLQDGVIKKTALPGKPAISLTPDLLAKLLLTLDNKYDKNSLIKEWNSYHKKVAGHNLKNWEYNRIIKLFNEALLDSSKKDLNGLPVAVLTGILALDPEYKNNFAEFTKTLSDLAGDDYLDLTCAEIPDIFSDKNYPPKFNSIYLGYKGRRAVPTCVEDALRNIIYALFWNPDTKELDLKQINPQVKLNKNFIKFIENYKTDLISTEAAQDWMDLVSGIPGVLYFRDKYELQGDIENGFKVLSFLFQSDINSWNDFFDVIKLNNQHSFSGNAQHKGNLSIDKLSFKIEVDVCFWNAHSFATIYYPNGDESKEKNYKFLESCLSINNPTKNQRLVSYLLFNKIIPDINTQEQLIFRYTPLHFALSRNRLETSKMLIEYGADVNAKGGLCGETPLHLAAKKGNLEIVRLLIEHGADVNARNQEGNTPLHFAASCNRLEISKLLIEHGADLNAANSDGYTALMLAARDGHKAVVNRLIESGANLNAANSNGYTALVLAARDGHESVVNRLIESGANLNAANSNGYTALVLAARFGHEAVVNRLIEAGANLSAVNIDGNTALMLAARRGREAVVNRLIEAGADLNAANCWNGDTPLYTALKYKFIGFVNLLKSYKFKK